jgi:uncharacterized membrane protein YeaQ/YmgE (transglycosylase-associated protein family)
MKKRSLSLQIHAFILAFIIGAVPANFISGFVNDKDDRFAVLSFVWLMVGVPAFLILREKEDW